MSRRELSYYETERLRQKSSRRGRRGRRNGGGNFSTFSSSPASRRDEGRTRRFSAFDWLMVVVSVAVAAGVVASWGARWIEPSRYGFMSAAGLVMPPLFVANFVCLLYWLIRWRRGVFIPLPVFVAGLWGVSLYFKPRITKDHTAAARDRSLVTLTTYNVRGLARMQETRPGAVRSSMGEVISIVDSLRPDILCMQEFAPSGCHPRSVFDEALPAYHYKRLWLRSREGARLDANDENNETGWGNAIYSKFPIAAAGHIDFGEGTDNSTLWADVAVGRDTLRVYCVHLQTTSIKADDEKYIVGMNFVGDSTLARHMGRMAGDLRRNNVVRARQADTLAASIASSPHPVVVCGDFNDTPSSYSYRVVASGLADSFREAGEGYGYTYRGFFNLLRIDYVLHSPSLGCVGYSSPSFSNSDHNPVSVKLKIKGR